MDHSDKLFSVLEVNYIKIQHLIAVQKYKNCYSSVFTHRLFFSENRHQNKPRIECIFWKRFA